MAFNSFDFVVFFPAVVGIYFLLPQRCQWMFLLAASYFFYGVHTPAYLVLLAATTVVAYGAARAMSRQPIRQQRKPYLAASLLFVVGSLIVFKYAGFVLQSTNTALRWLAIPEAAPDIDWLLPLGISFYTFQVTAYLVDVYYGRLKAERHLGIFALFVSFFPQLVAGPIERAKHLLPQFHRRHALDPVRLAGGVRRIAWGFFKKLVIADRLGMFVDQVYAQPEAYGWATVCTAGCFFAVQLYCDFSGYCDIAIGAARILGFDLSENFRRPYLATSISDAWTRWHITLSTWLRDYVFLPICRSGKRISKTRWYFAYFVTMLLCGLWHGAGWNFVLLGVILGVALIARSWTEGFRIRLWRWLGAVLYRGAKAPGKHADPLQATEPLRRAAGWLTTVAIAVPCGMVFRAASLGDAWTLARSVMTAKRTFVVPEFSDIDYFVVLLATVLMLTLEISPRLGSKVWGCIVPGGVRWAAYACFVMIIFLFGQFQTQEFVYIQF